MKLLNKKFGFTLIELLLVFSVLILIISSSFFIYKSVQSKYKDEQFISDNVQLYSAIKSLYGNSANANYQKLSAYTLIKAGLLNGSRMIPKNYNDRYYFINTYGGSTDVQGTYANNMFNVSSKYFSAFTISNKNVSLNGCMRLISQFKNELTVLKIREGYNGSYVSYYTQENYTKRLKDYTPSKICFSENNNIVMAFDN